MLCMSDIASCVQARASSGVRERRGGSRLQDQSSDSIGIAASRGEQLQRDAPMQMCIVREEHLAHPAGTVAPQDLIPAEGTPWCERHGISVHYRSRRASVL